MEDMPALKILRVKSMASLPIDEGGTNAPPS
jgi:hypothetical protein